MPDVATVHDLTARRQRHDEHRAAHQLYGTRERVVAMPRRCPVTPLPQHSSTTVNDSSGPWTRPAA